MRSIIVASFSSEDSAEKVAPGHPAYGPMGETVYCDGSCQRVR